LVAASSEGVARVASSAARGERRVEMSERALKSVENARRVLDHANETLKGGNAVTTVKDGKENAPAATAVEDDRAVDALKERVNEMNIGDKAESSEREVKDAVAEKPASGYESEELEKNIADVVGDWLGDLDGVSAEVDRVMGLDIQTLFAPLRGDETLEKLRADKSALKRRLRRFDVRVSRTTGRKTTREDKKHLRPLYVRLAKIKGLIAIREAGG
jgi:uncharacterized Zn ribbon protein